MRWWQECDEYRVQVAAYRGKDARDALVVYAATLLVMLALGIYHRVAPEWPGNAAAVAIGLIELEEGVRLVAGLVGVKREELSIGMPLQLEFKTFDGELTLPLFRALSLPAAE